jgi:hypothetical protein
MDENPPMPVEVMVEQTAPDPDYADGDDPGWFSSRWDPDAQTLTLRYEPDDEYGPEDRRYGAAEHVFRLAAPAEMDGPTLGETAYRGYLAACGGKSLISGAELPPWAEQGPRIQAAWQAAADAVRGPL